MADLSSLNPQNNPRFVEYQTKMHELNAEAIGEPAIIASYFTNHPEVSPTQVAIEANGVITGKDIHEADGLLADFFFQKARERNIELGASPAVANILAKLDARVATLEAAAAK